MPSIRPRFNPSSRHRTGHLALGITVGVAAAAVAATGFFLPRSLFFRGVASTTVTSSATTMTTELVPGALATWLSRVGLDPRALAAAGVLPAQINQLAADARAHLTEHVAALNAAQEAVDGARQELQAMEGRVRAGLASAEELNHLAFLRSSSAQAHATLDTAKAAFLAASTASLSEAQRSALAALARNDGYEVPFAYRVVERDSRAWHALRNDLAHARVADRRSETAHPEVAQRLAVANAEPAVAASLNHTQSNLQPLADAWINATQ